MVTWGGVYRAGEGTHKSKGERGDVATSPRSNEHPNTGIMTLNITFGEHLGHCPSLWSSVIVMHPGHVCGRPLVSGLHMRSVSPEKAEDRAQGVKPDSGLAARVTCPSKADPCTVKGAGSGPCVWTSYQECGLAGRLKIGRRGFIGRGQVPWCPLSRSSDTVMHRARGHWQGRRAAGLVPCLGSENDIESFI